jgi:hypothetical protein
MLSAVTTVGNTGFEGSDSGSFIEVFLLMHRASLVQPGPLVN